MTKSAGERHLEAEEAFSSRVKKVVQTQAAEGLEIIIMKILHVRL